MSPDEIHAEIDARRAEIRIATRSWFIHRTLSAYLAQSTGDVLEANPVGARFTQNPKS